MARTPLGTISEYIRHGENSTPPNLALSIGHPAALADANLALFGCLARGEVSARLRKLATLSVAAVLRNGYEWGHHAPTAAGVGISKECVDAIRNGERGVLDDSDQLIVDYAAAVERQDVSDDLWRRVSAELTVPQQVQLTTLSALYGFYSRIQVALQVDQDRGYDSEF
jgi:alkylhydroperoxidase family enzyme